MDLDLLDRALADASEPAFRARQVWRWTAAGAHGYGEMTDLPAALRARLAADLPFSTLALEHEAHAVDGTVKALFRTRDGRALEAVLMRYRDGRRSVCVSSQSGCPLTCSFCATGSMRFGRNLTASEILDQVLHFRRIEPVDHLAFMGMGEPMMNLDHVLAAAARLPDASTTEVLAACEAHHRRRRRRIFVEYVMLAGFNDAYGQAVQLARLLDPRIYKVNLIPYNPTGAVYEGSSRAPVAAFNAALEEHGLRATVRLTRGRDIDAACGQLAAKAPAAAAAAIG